MKVIIYINDQMENKMMWFSSLKTTVLMNIREIVSPSKILTFSWRMSIIDYISWHFAKFAKFLKLPDISSLSRHCEHSVLKHVDGILNKEHSFY